MPTLERRVQVLFDPAEYEQLEAYAKRERRSVSAVVRASVRRTLDDQTAKRRAAYDQLMALADPDSAEPVGDWDAVKESFERESLRDIP